MLEITPLFLILTAELLTLTTFVLKIILKKPRCVKSYAEN